MSDTATPSRASGCPVAHGPLSSERTPTGCPVSQRAAGFDPFEDGYQQDPPEYVRWAREQEPIFYSPKLGYKNVEAAALVGVVVPSATPADVVNTLNRQLVAAINEPSVRTRMVDFGVEPVGNTPAQYAALLRSETERWHKLIRDLKITLD